jgi:threonine-phosphate decarboxylase
MIKGHGGNIYDLAERLSCDASEIIDMSSNINPFGPPPGLVDYLKDHILRINALPEVDARNTSTAFAHRYGIDPDRVLAGNGTTQFIYSIPQVLRAERVLIVGPTYADYADGCRMHGVPFEYYISEESKKFNPDFAGLETSLNSIDTVFICNPNNPTGVLIPINDLLNLIRGYPNIRFVIDESYLPFVKDGDKESMLQAELPNLLILHSLSKIFRIPGLRIGFLVAPKVIIEKFLPYMLPWNVNSLSQIAVQYLMANRAETESFIHSIRDRIRGERELLRDTLSKSSCITVNPSTTSFMLLHLNEGITAEDTVEYLSHHKILIRNCANFEGLSNKYIRLSLKTEDANRMAAQLLMDMDHKYNAG